MKKDLPPLPKKKPAVFHHPLGFELYDGLAMDLHAVTYAEPLLKEIERLQQIVAALAVPVGQMLVPVRPTDEMVEAAAMNADVSTACIRVIYADMLDAARKPPNAK